MHIGKIKYGKSFQHHDGLWEKIGVDVYLNDTDDEDKGRVLAKKFVEDAFVKNNPQLPLPVVATTETQVTFEADPVFLAAKMTIEQAQYKEDAEEVLIASGFRFNVELKNLVNSKPKKQQ